MTNDNALVTSETVKKSEQTAPPILDPLENLDHLYAEFQSDVFPYNWKNIRGGFRKEWRGYTFMLLLTADSKWRYFITKGEDNWESNGVFDDNGHDMATAFAKWCKLTELYPNAVLGGVVDH
jgi:hypothetical protein